MKLSFPVRIYVVSIILRFIPILLLRGLGIGLDDMFQYDMLARSLASGHGYRWYAKTDLVQLEPYVNFDLSTAKGYDPGLGLYTSFRAPLYPAFLAVVYFFSGTGFTRFLAARIVQVVFLGGPLAPLTYFITMHFSESFIILRSDKGKEKVAESIAKTSAWVVACYPMFLIYPLGLNTENPFFVLLLVSFLYLLRSIREPSTYNLLISGIFLGLTALTRSVILPFAAGAFVYLIYLHRNKALWAVMAFLVIVTPWIIRNSLLHGKLTGIETSMGYNLYLGYYPTGNGSFIFGPSLDLLTIMDDSERDAIGTQKAIGFIREQPGRFIPLMINRLGFFFGFEKRVFIYFYSNNLIGYVPRTLLLTLAAIIFLPFVVISLSGVFGFALFKWNMQTLLLSLLFLFYLLPHVLILAEDRFHLALIPFIAILASNFWARGFDGILARWQESSAGKLLIGFAVVCACLLLINWAGEIVRDADKIAVLLSPTGNQSYFPY